MRAPIAPVIVATIVAATSAATSAQDGFRFRSGVELINVTATVTDDNGRFVSGLRQNDFTLYEDGQAQEITHFSNERVPVSLGIVLDTSGSMTPDKMSAARAAIDRFAFDLLGPDDELFFMEFNNAPRLMQQFTKDRRAISRAVSRVNPAGGTAMFDAVADAVPLADAGQNRKKALLVISDGNDTNSNIRVSELRQLIRESEVMVYALGVDGTTSTRSNGGTVVRPPQLPIPIPFPFPGSGRRPYVNPSIGQGASRLAKPAASPQVVFSRGSGDRVNADALRQITDDTGGRTEIVRGFDGLDAATARIADELSKQYYLGYASSGDKDGRWHAIRVEVRDRRLTVRARRGYVAS
jgi:Ca-activated chloride channel family protein